MRKASKILSLVAFIFSLINAVESVLCGLGGVILTVFGCLNLTMKSGSGEVIINEVAAALLVIGIILVFTAFIVLVTAIIGAVLSAINKKQITIGFNKKPLGLAITTIVISVLCLGCGIQFILLLVAGILLLVAKPETLKTAEVPVEEPKKVEEKPTSEKK